MTRRARALVLGVNLAIGGILLAWLVRLAGEAAMGRLSSASSLVGLLAFLAVVAVAIAGLTWRWRLLLSGLGAPPPFVRLAGYRSAGQTLAALLPSARIGGDPLRAWLATRAQVTASDAISSVAVDRVLEIGAAAPFSIVFAAVLIQRGVPELRSALLTVLVATAALVFAAVTTARRLREGRGLVTSFVRRTRLDALPAVGRHMDVLERSEAAAARLVVQRRRLALAFGAGFGTNLLVMLEYGVLFSALGLPADALTIVAAIFASAAAQQLPVPAGVGVLEGGQVWMLGMLGYPPEVGLAAGFAVRLRELVWALPGLICLAARWLSDAHVRSRRPAAPAAATGDRA